MESICQKYPKLCDSVRNVQAECSKMSNSLEPLIKKNDGILSKLLEQNKKIKITDYQNSIKTKLSSYSGKINCMRIYMQLSHGYNCEPFVTCEEKLVSLTSMRTIVKDMAASVRAIYDNSLSHASEIFGYLNLPNEVSELEAILEQKITEQKAIIGIGSMKKKTKR